MSGKGLFGTLANDDATYMASSAENAARAEVAAQASESSASESAASARAAAASLGQMTDAVTQSQTAAAASEQSAQKSLAAKTAAETAQQAAEDAARRAANADHDMQVQIDEARAWANKTTGPVDGSEYSSKYYSNESAKSAAAAKQTQSEVAGVIQNSKDWANKTTGPVDGSEYSSKYYATQAKGSENSVKQSELNARSWADASAASANTSKNWSDTSEKYANQGVEQVQRAKAEADRSGSYVTAAKNEADRSQSYVASASAEADRSQSYIAYSAANASLARAWAESSVPVVTNGYSAKYWADVAKGFAGQDYVKRAGDTMTGNLVIDNPSAQGTLTVKSNDINGNSTAQFTSTMTGAYIGVAGAGATIGDYGIVLNARQTKSSIQSVYNVTTQKADLEFKSFTSRNGDTVQSSMVMDSTGSLHLRAGDFYAPVYGAKSLKQYIDDKSQFTPSMLDPYVLKTTTVNGKPLSTSIALNADDVRAVDVNRTINGKPLSSNVTLIAENVFAVPNTATINGKPLISNPVLKITDMGGVPETRTINGKPLSSDIVLTAQNLDALPSRGDIVNINGISLNGFPTMRLVGANQAGFASWSASTDTHNMVTSTLDLFSGDNLRQVRIGFSQAGIDIGTFGDIKSSLWGGSLKTYIDNKTSNIDTSGFVPTSRTINGKPLVQNIQLIADDIPLVVPTRRTVNGKPLVDNITLNAADVGAVDSNRTVNGKFLTSNIILNADDVKAVPLTRTVNGKALSSSITLLASDIPGTLATTGAAMTGNLTMTNNTAVVMSGNWISKPADRDGITIDCQPISGSVRHKYTFGQNGVLSIPGDMLSPVFGKTNTGIDKTLTQYIKDQIGTVDSTAFVPTSRTINGWNLTTNISLSANDVKAVPATATVNGKLLTSNPTITAADLGVTGQMAELKITDRDAGIPTNIIIPGNSQGGINLLYDEQSLSTTLYIGYMNSGSIVIPSRTKICELPSKYAAGRYGWPGPNNGVASGLYDGNGKRVGTVSIMQNRVYIIQEVAAQYVSGAITYNRLNGFTPSTY